MTSQQWINDLDEMTLRSLVKKHPGSIKYIDKPTYQILKIVIDLDVDYLSPNIIMCEKTQKYLLSKYPDMFHLIKEPTDEVTEIALEVRPANILYVQNPTDEQLIKAFASNPKLIGMITGDRLNNMSDHVKSYVKIIA